MGPSCRAAPAPHCCRSPPWASPGSAAPWPHISLIFMAELAAPGPHCPFLACPWDHDTGNGTSRILLNCTQLPIPMGTHGFRAHCGSGGYPGAPAGRRLLVPQQPHPAASCPASCPCTPSLPAAGTNTVHTAAPQPSCSMPSIPEHPGTQRSAPQQGTGPGLWQGAGPQARVIEMNLISHVAAKLKIYKKFVVYKKVSVQTRPPLDPARAGSQRRWHTVFTVRDSGCRVPAWGGTGTWPTLPGSPHRDPTTLTGDKP